MESRCGIAGLVIRSVKEGGGGFVHADRFDEGLEFGFLADGDGRGADQQRRYFRHAGAGPLSCLMEVHPDRDAHHGVEVEVELLGAAEVVVDGIEVGEDAVVVEVGGIDGGEGGGAGQEGRFADGVPVVAV